MAIVRCARNAGTVLAWPDAVDRLDRVTGVLLGVALGDAAGLPFEGLSARRIARRSTTADRFRLVGRTGFVSDDTEQSALVAEALLVGGDDDGRCLRAFRARMIDWFARLPFGIGGATLRACVRMALGLRHPGVWSAGNGAAMRSGILGAALADEPVRRRDLSRAFARLTHTDERAVQAAGYVADLTAACVVQTGETARASLVADASAPIDEPRIAAAVSAATTLAAEGAPLQEAVATLGNSGFVVCSVGLCTFVFLRFGDDPVEAIEASIRAGGDTDTHAAIVGGWTGALYGASALPESLLSEIHDGPFGPTHLRGLASALVESTPPPRWSRVAALLRNLALYPVVIAHGFARLMSW